MKSWLEGTLETARRAVPLHRPIGGEVLSRLVPTERIIWRGRADVRRLALTFDDGPDPLRTPELLDLLDHLNIRATFFVVGQHVEHHPELAAEIVQRGHELGNHTYSHERGALETAAGVREEIDRANRAVALATGCEPALFRPPAGMLGMGLVRCCHQKGMTIAMWSFDTGDLDWKLSDGLGPSLDNVRAGDIILLHDSTDVAVDVVARQVPRLLRRGFEFATVSGMIAN